MDQYHGVNFAPFFSLKVFRLTYRRPFSHHGSVRSVQELGLIVIDVLDFDDEPGLRFDWQVCFSVSSLSSQGVVCLLFSVQPLGGVNVSCVLIDSEDGRRSFTVQNVPHLIVTFIHVRVELHGPKTR